MKKLLIIAGFLTCNLFISAIAQGQTVFTFCASGSEGSYDYISNVQLDSINNSSYFPAGGFTNYASIGTSMVKQQSAILTITNGAPTTNALCGVWIDWNHNGDFADDTIITVSGGPSVFTALIKVPYNAILGDATMRIVLNTDSVPEPCGTDHFGETEDYQISVIITEYHEVEVTSAVDKMLAASYPASFHPQIHVYNVGYYPEVNTLVTYVFNDNIILTDTIHDTLYPNDNILFEFAESITLNTCGNYPFKAYSSTPNSNDYDYDDDTISGTFNAAKYLTVNTSGNIPDLVESELQGSGLVISNVAFSGNAASIGTFNADCSDFNLNSGLMMSTGLAATAIGPNNNTTAGTDLGLSGNPLLSALNGGATYDAAVLEFDITPMYDSIQLKYVFGSEEYPFNTGTSDDIMGIFISGPQPGGGNYISHNISLVPGTTNTPVSVSTINYGTDDAGTCTNCAFYERNYGNSLQTDAYTVPLTAGLPAIPGQTYHVVIAIADAANHATDSYLFLKKGSFSSIGGNASVAGFIRYDNAQGTPLDGVTVKLTQNNNLVSQTVSDANGFYTFNGIPDGTYNLQLETQTAWGGVNSADALLIQKHFVGISTLTGLPLQAANLNTDAGINSSDALLAVKRFAGLITDFPIHKDWIFENHTAVVTANSTASQVIKGICSGDVNRSFVP